MSKQVFISYSSADQDIARQVCNYLEQGGLTCWIAPRDVVPSAEYAEQLIGAIESARLMLLILSDKSNTSPQVVREVERAVSNGMPILPFRIEDVQLTKSMEYFISSNHWLDACEGEVQNYYPDLLQAIQTTLTGSQGRLRGNGSQPPGEMIFTLEFHCDGSNVQVRSSEGMAHEQKTLKYYDNVVVSLENITKYADGIKDILSSASREGTADKHALDRLQQLGQLLYDELFPTRTKENLNRTESRSLILGMDDQLVAIPWELIFDGREFLCQRFSMGRVVSTRQEIIGSQRQCGIPLKALLMADPQGNLPSAYSEGMKIRDLFDEHEDLVEAGLGDDLGQGGVKVVGALLGLHGEEEDLLVVHVGMGFDVHQVVGDFEVLHGSGLEAAELAGLDVLQAAAVADARIPAIRRRRSDISSVERAVARTRRGGISRRSP